MNGADVKSTSQDRQGDPVKRPSAGGTRVRVRTLVLIRWLAISGQLITLFVVSSLVGERLPMVPALIALSCSAVLNLIIGMRWDFNGWHNEPEATGFLAFDILQLSVLLYLTGGLENPFALLLLAPVTISATILGLISTVCLGMLAFACMTVLIFFFLPLPWPFGDFVMPEGHSLAILLALTVCMTFLLFYASRVARESRRMADALTATQLALAREQEVSSLGALAANAAHALGTPLGTIALVVKELQRSAPEDGDLAEDLHLLQDQSNRCREILAGLSKSGFMEEDPQFFRQTMNVLAAAAAEPYGEEGVDVICREIPPENGAPAPFIRRSAELHQGLTNFIDNAVDFAESCVEIETTWNDQEIRLTIQDDGPGFSANVFALLGDPYVSTRRNRGGMGLGVFISKTLLERTGASIRFSNRRGQKGAVVAIAWPRAEIEAL
jgi:two-component system, sensor histidine kinase RegB